LVKSIAVKISVMKNTIDDGHTTTSLDAHELDRFLIAQQLHYATALQEINKGRKQTHWMWYIFPQIQGLGFSATAKYYEIKDISQASAYLDHPVLGHRLIAVSQSLLKHKESTARDIFGSPDDLKLCSCMTLFASIPIAPTLFQQVIDEFFSGIKDLKTLRVLELQSYG